MNAVAPIQAVEARVICSTMFGTILANKAATVKPPSNPHRPRTEVINPPDFVSSKNQPKAKPPAAETKYLAMLKKKIPIPAPMNDATRQARR